MRIITTSSIPETDISSLSSQLTLSKLQNPQMTITGTYVHTEPLRREMKKLPVFAREGE